jgi:hypothetical protein
VLAGRLVLLRSVGVFIYRKIPMPDQMQSPVQHSLGDEECACLNRVLARTPELLQLAKTCTDCGWDVSAATEALNEQHEIARKAKAAFFPNRP